MELEEKGEGNKIKYYVTAALWQAYAANGKVGPASQVTVPKIEKGGKTHPRPILQCAAVEENDKKEYTMKNLFSLEVPSLTKRVNDPTKRNSSIQATTQRELATHAQDIPETLAKTGMGNRIFNATNDVGDFDLVNKMADAPLVVSTLKPYRPK